MDSPLEAKWKPYLAWMLSSSPESMRAWLDPQAQRAALALELAQTIATRVSSRVHIARFAAACPVPAARPEDYALQEVQVLPDAVVLAGIHFRNLLTQYPFIGVFAQTRSFSRSEIQETCRVLSRAFAVFAAPQIRFWSPEQDDLRTLPGARSDLRLLVGRLTDLDPSPNALPESFTLETDRSGHSYPEYCRMLDAFLELHPRWRKDLSRTDLDEYTRAAQHGMLCELRQAGRVLGVIAARSERLRGIVGWEMLDEILDHSVRGRGLASLMQRAFLARLDPRRHPLVFGTIAPDNTQSLRTALRAGRKDVGGWVFLPAPRRAS